MKQCTKCKEFKDEGEFYKKGDGLTSWCKVCAAAANAARADHLASLEERTCNTCGETKPGKEFHRGCTQCKACAAAADAARADYLATLEERTCNTCGETKPGKEFHHGATQCKTCVAAAGAAHRDYLATLEERTCTKCGKTKPGKEFYRGQPQCKACQAAYNAAYADYLATLEERTCNTCGVTKPGKEFYHGATQCKTCVAAYYTTRHASNKHDKILYVMTHQIYLDNDIVALGETINSTSRKHAYHTHWVGEVITLHTYPLGDKTDKDVFKYLADHGVLPIDREFYRYTQKLVELLDSYFLAI